MSGRGRRRSQAPANKLCRICRRQIAGKESQSPKAMRENRLRVLCGGRQTTDRIRMIFLFRLENLWTKKQKWENSTRRNLERLRPCKAPKKGNKKPAIETTFDCRFKHKK